MDKILLIQKYIICPFCKSDVGSVNLQLHCKKCGKVFNIMDSDIPSMIGSLTLDTEFSMAKWDDLYQREFFANEAEKEYKQLFLDDTLRQVLEYVDKNKENEKVYLEIGCGPGFLGEELAKRGWLFIGVDFSPHALILLKKRLNSRGIKNYLLIHADIQSLPICSNSINLIFGGGVIEHFKNTQIVINHAYASLAEKGVLFNAVPFFNIGNMIYRSIWGGIPNVPVLKQLAELIHLKILKGKHMIFGYELQFTTSQLKKLHINTGFKPDNVIVDRFDCYIQLHWVRNRFFKDFMRNFCKKNRQFWPAIKVIGIKK